MRNAVAVMIIVACATPSFAQSTVTATISGGVMDRSGAAVQDAEVRIHRSKEAKQPEILDQSIRTDANGRFSIAAVPGSYDLCVRAKGL